MHRRFEDSLKKQMLGKILENKHSAELTVTRRDDRKTNNTCKHGRDARIRNYGPEVCDSVTSGSF